MIRRYDFGTPISTGAIAIPQPVCTGDMPRFAVSKSGDAVSFTVKMDEDDMIFGLGESVRGINKRGHLPQWGRLRWSAGGRLPPRRTPTHPRTVPTASSGCTEASKRTRAATLRGLASALSGSSGKPEQPEPPRMQPPS